MKRTCEVVEARVDLIDEKLKSIRSTVLN
jgi:hypothetical protein